MSGASEFDATLFSLGRLIRRLFDSYCSTNDPSELDVLIYQVTTLFRMIRASQHCSTQLLEDIEVGLSLLEARFPAKSRKYLWISPSIIIQSLQRPPTDGDSCRPATIFVRVRL